MLDGAQQPPKPGTDFSTFPRDTPEPGRGYYRAHHEKNSAWFFSGDRGRFDLGSEFGTSYWADSPKTALRERLRGAISDKNLLSPGFVKELAISVSTLPPALCANISHPDASEFGVTVALSGGEVDYSMSQTWAGELSSVGFDGVRYTARFTPGQSNSWALFGDGGPHIPDGAEVSSTVLGNAAVKLAETFVEPVPALAELAETTDPPV